MRDRLRWEGQSLVFMFFFLVLKEAVSSNKPHCMMYWPWWLIIHFQLNLERVKFYSKKLIFFQTLWTPWHDWLMGFPPPTILQSNNNYSVLASREILLAFVLTAWTPPSCLLSFLHILEEDRALLLAREADWRVRACSGTSENPAQLTLQQVEAEVPRFWKSCSNDVL